MVWYGMVYPSWLGPKKPSKRKNNKPKYSGPLGPKKQTTQTLFKLLWPFGSEKQKTRGDKSYVDRLHGATLSNLIDYMVLNSYLV